MLPLPVVQPHVVTVGLDGVNCIHRQDISPPATAHDDSSEVGVLRLASARRFQERENAVTMRLEIAHIASFDGARHDLRQAIRLYRLENVVERRHLERLDGVRIIRGNEGHVRDLVRAHVTKKVDTGHAGHLDVEKYKVGTESPDLR